MFRKVDEINVKYCKPINYYFNQNQLIKNN